MTGVQTCALPIYPALALAADAARALGAVLALAPDDTAASIALAAARQRLGEERGALELARRALARAPTEARDPLQALASEWERSGSVEAAAELRAALAGR